MTITKEEFMARLEEVGRNVTARAAIEAAETANTPAEPAEKVEKIGKQISFWPESVAAMPTELTRVSLFGLPSDRRGARKMLDDVLLESRPDIQVRYTGKQLSAKDETCWLACLRLGRGLPMGQRIYLNKNDLLKEMGLARTGQNWKTTEARLDRLSKAHFTIEFKRNGKSYRMTTGLMKYGIENETGAMYIRLDPDGAALFENLAYQPWQVRLSLKSDVSARLLSYVTGHEQGKPHSQTLENLKRWCGYTGETRKFRAAIRASLEELESKGVLVKGSSKIVSGGRGDVVCWVRSRIDELTAIEAKP